LSVSKRIYIAVEIPSRELHAKVLLACIAAEKGYTAIIGNSAEMRDALRTWKPGTIVWKGLVKKAQKNYKLFHYFEHTVVAQCEEGLVYSSADFYTSLRVSEDALEELDLFFSWGGNQTKDILSKLPGQKEKIVLAGNPRIDLLDERFRGVFNKEVEKIKKKYSPYLLVNTNFSTYTHSLGPEAVIQRLKAKGTIKNPEEEAFYRGRSENRKILFREFIQMFEMLDSSMANYTILLRPHPSEDISLWRDSVSHLKNVQVVREGSAIPWIVGCELMIHNDCTTAIEASILGKNVISYRPTANNPYESKLAVLPGVSTETIGGLEKTIKNMLDGNDNEQKVAAVRSKEKLKKYISSIGGDLACEVIVNHIDQLLNSSMNHRRKNHLERIKMFARRYRYRMSYYKKYRKEVKMNRRNGDFYKQNKNSFSLSYVEKIIEELNANSNLFADLKVTPVRKTHTCFTISRK